MISDLARKFFAKHPWLNPRKDWQICYNEGTPRRVAFRWCPCESIDPRDLLSPRGFAENCICASCFFPRLHRIHSLWNQTGFQILLGTCCTGSFTVFPLVNHPPPAGWHALFFTGSPRLVFGSLPAESPVTIGRRLIIVAHLFQHDELPLITCATTKIKKHNKPPNLCCLQWSPRVTQKLVPKRPSDASCGFWRSPHCAPALSTASSESIWSPSWERPRQLCQDSGHRPQDVRIEGGCFVCGWKWKGNDDFQQLHEWVSESFE